MKSITRMTGKVSFETPIKHAPEVKLHNGASWVPQHYLLYEHNLESVEAVVANIDFDECYPLFVCEVNACVYIQVGIISVDNYKSGFTQRHKKIVYGRKWRVETQLPTSEIIQTVFLAIKTAREHEIRELFRLKLNNKTVTPFNNHHDLPLMAENSELVRLKCASNLSLTSTEDINRVLQNLSYNDASICATRVTQHGTSCLVDFKLQLREFTYLPELSEHEFTLVFSRINANAIYHKLMGYFIGLSEKYIQDHFSYCGFNRFSDGLCVERIGELSAHTRDKTHYKNRRQFAEQLARSNYDTDSTRVPVLTNGANSQKVKKLLSANKPLTGQLPIISDTE